jgi:hypothetical protein
MPLLPLVLPVPELPVPELPVPELPVPAPLGPGPPFARAQGLRGCCPFVAPPPDPG